MKNKNDAKAEYRRAIFWERLHYAESTVKNIPDSCRRLTQSAKEAHYPVPYVYASYIMDAIIFGHCIDDYLEKSLFRYSLVEKNLRYSLRREVRLDHLYSKKASPDELLNLQYKSRFVKVYRDFLNREVCIVPEHSDDEVTAFVKKFHKVIAKPYDLYGGKGIFMLNEDELDSEKLAMLRSGKYLLEELVVQHPKMAAINPTSVNTVRVITILDAEGVMHVEEAYIRAGYPGSVTDNITAGGVSYPLDGETGIVIGRGNPYNGWKKYIIHPGSHQIMPGFQVPHWEYILQMLDKAAHVQPKVRRIGWDVAVTQEDALLIEGNLLPGMDEFFEPIYYRAKEYLKPAEKRKL